MKRTPTNCAVTMLVIALSVAGAGAFACQIDCAVMPAAPPMNHAGACGGHGDMPGHTPDRDHGGHQRSGHTHSRIMAAAQSSNHKMSLHQGGLLPHNARSYSALGGEYHPQLDAFTTAKSPGLIFNALVLRI